MESNPDGEYYHRSIVNYLFLLAIPFDGGIAIALICIVLLLIASAIISGSEVAYFSLNAQDKDDLQKSEVKSDLRIHRLLKDERYLLATILAGNNLFNVAIIILGYFSIGKIFDFGDNKFLEVLINVVLITSILVLFGEIIPKIYARGNRLKMARFASFPLIQLSRLTYPINFLLVNTTNIIEKRLMRNGDGEVDIDEIEDAIDLTIHEDDLEEDNRILKGIINFGNITVKQIMKARVDVIAIEDDSDFEEVYQTIIDSGFSRIPVYKEDLDDIVGIMYAKDTLEYLAREKTFNWKKLLRKPYFVPETKKIDDLLREFQKRRIHLAIVFDEFGGTMGLITMEDILEEVLGEIQDEYDSTDEIDFQQIDLNNYTFEGKTLLNDISRVLKIDGAVFEEVKGDADSLAGLILEITGEMPDKNQEVVYEQFKFNVMSVSEDRIEKVKVTIVDDPPSLVS